MSTGSGFLRALDELIVLADRRWDDIYIEASGLWSGKPWNSPHGVMSSFEISYILEGNAILHMNNREYQAEKGNFYFSDLSLHTSCTQPGLKLYYVTFGTHSSQLCRTFQSCFKRMSECPQPICSNSMENYFTAFFYENSIKKSYHHLLSKHAFLQILVNLYRLLIMQSDKESRTSSGSRQENLTGEIVKYLGENYHRNLELKDIALKYALDPRYVNSLFKSVTGSTIIQYLIKLRTEKAKRLLNFTDMSITDIALDTGFYDCQHFCRTFKRVEGITPTEFRKNNGHKLR